jgi:regulator of protease activity HflC (stomatin/prohibitin superfamily)
MDGHLGAGLCGCGCLFFIILIILFFTCLKTVDQTQACVKYDWWYEAVGEEVYTQPGMVWVGLGNYLICYPSTNQYVYFRNFDGNLEATEFDIFLQPMSARSNDGLLMQLELEFVYKPQLNKIREIYMRVGDAGFQHVLVNLANGVLNNEATKYNAIEFFDDRARVQDEFTTALRDYLSETLFMDITTLQLQPAHFPDLYEKSILDTQVMNQDIQVAEQEQKTARVKKQTEFVQAEMLAKRAVIAAEAEASKVNWTNGAEVSMYALRQQLDAEGFQKALEWFVTHGGGVQEFLDYLNALAMVMHNQASMTMKVPTVAS